MRPDFVDEVKNSLLMLLRLLLDRCEKGVMSLVNVRNCIRFYQTAEELNASTLMNYCAEIIANHW
ncbi:putative Ankyrin repeat and FYVE domain-containing protein, partial [Naja naja]